MKKKLLFVSLSILFCLVLDAQVTIGSSLKPNQGSILDLKENDSTGAVESTASKGLLLPRVKLEAVDMLKPMYSYTDENNTPTTDDLEKHAGLLVYSIEEFGYPSNCPGLYVWTGKSWEMVKKENKISSTFTDGEGNEYPYEKIGKLYWITQNIRTVTEYGNGSVVNGEPRLNPAIKSGDNTAVIIAGGAIPEGNVVYNIQENGGVKRTVNESYADYAAQFGLLYTWEQAQKACPTGWRIPTPDDWTELIYYLDPNTTSTSTLAGERMKIATSRQYWSSGGDTSTSNWRGLSACDKNLSGFDALPAGTVRTDGLSSGGFGGNTTWWTDTSRKCVYVNGNDTYAVIEDYDNENFYSVRCVRGTN